MNAMSRNEATIAIPDREALLRDGIPPEVIQHFRRQARRLRADTFASAFGRLRRWLSFRSGRAIALRCGPAPSSSGSMAQRVVQEQRP
jgi:hypothetical protein